MESNQINRDGIIVGLCIVAFAALMAWQTTLIPEGAGYSQVGPSVIPWIVTGFIAMLGAVIVAQSWFGYWMVMAETDYGPVQTLSLIWIGIALLLNLALIGLLGFILASTAMFLCAARAFGSTRPLRDAGIGFSIAFIAYFGFDRLLGYQIGDGVIENLL